MLSIDQLLQATDNMLQEDKAGPYSWQLPVAVLPVLPVMMLLALPTNDVAIL